MNSAAAAAVVAVVVAAAGVGVGDAVEAARSPVPVVRDAGEDQAACPAEHSAGPPAQGDPADLPNLRPAPDASPVVGGLAAPAVPGDQSVPAVAVPPGLAGVVAAASAAQEVPGDRWDRVAVAAREQAGPPARVVEEPPGLADPQGRGAREPPVGAGPPPGSPPVPPHVRRRAPAPADSGDTPPAPRQRPTLSLATFDWSSPLPPPAG